MKLVVTFETKGDYECGSHTYYKCVEYSSVEAFYCDFKDKIEEKKKLDKEYRDRINEEWEKLRKRIRNSNEEMPEVVVINDLEQKVRAFEKFEFAGVLWDSYDLDLFTDEVQTLDDWWLSHHHSDGGGH